ncbi:MAG: hypothetical protein CMA08_00445 [Euryarchaeota archaeon]|nr:hypothetical protein [Euryarchaeota archaeon]OUX23342.1 MAG: hypothetical protein CBE12_00455 [Euryarchaeota archaeon TMED252]|tara:strand:+ start:132 stop:659 length:528 start_codon:yes stop_codon:yes gene_type:complete
MRAAMLVMLLLTSSLAGCVGGGGEDEVIAFPAFESMADDGQNYSNEDFNGDWFIVIFSAEWCTDPCFDSMHAIWSVMPEAPVLVFSTDPNNEPQGINLSTWHETADAHDDEDDDSGVTLTSYRFLKGAEPAAALDITKPGSVAFVNTNGEVVYLHQGRLTDTDLIKEKMDLSSGV